MADAELSLMAECATGRPEKMPVMIIRNASRAPILIWSTYPVLY